MTGIASPASSRALRLDSAEPARISACVPVRFSSSRPVTNVGSSPTRVNVPASCSAAAIRRNLISGVEVATMSRTSRASRDSLPTSAMTDSLANRVLRRGRRPGCVAETPPQHASDPNQNSAPDIRYRQHQERDFGIIPDGIDQAAQQNNNQRRVSLVEVDPLEAVITPRAHHQKAEE